MGRGPGNTKTEELFKVLKIKDISNFKYIYNLRNNFFTALKKKYKWGTNKYYKFAALNKIHPTYIQEILSDSRYKRKNYQGILHNLKQTDSRKYDPFKLITPKNIYIGKPKGKWNPFEDIFGRNVLIIGAGSSAIRNKSKIEKFIKRNDLYVICLNTNKSISEKLIDLRTACHPFRIISDINNYSSKTNLAMPLSMLPKEIFEKVKNKNEKIKDYGISTNLNNEIKVKKNYCILPNSLAISYSLSIALAGKSKKIFLAGFDGYNEDDSKNDETDLILKMIKKADRKLKIISMTKTKYNLKQLIS
jgi:4-hydroxy 2-oxovalerate aldolase